MMKFQASTIITSHYTHMMYMPPVHSENMSNISFIKLSHYISLPNEQVTSPN